MENHSILSPLFFESYYEKENINTAPEKIYGIRKVNPTQLCVAFSVYDFITIFSTEKWHKNPLIGKSSQKAYTYNSGRCDRVQRVVKSKQFYF